ncbi:hypothetical protein K9M47_03225 [Candidatus Gracilibacteria bacterium]|nr:hypothetical protein [Candidatus Gracilibacteria bacterium]
MPKLTTNNFTFKIAIVQGIKTLVLSSRAYYQHYLNKHTKDGDIGTIEVKLKKPTRSEQQLRYYFVLIGLLAEHTDYDDEELHDAIMRLKFGTKKLKLGKDIIEVRKSVANNARLPKQEMSELISYTLEKCAEMEVVVPSKFELGYISN